ncbi:MAG: hypothetical protein PHE27_04270 [Alphaproteobacteria bacterium]|nr:hypothetical protein [Alphaproteobacteria bacterium]
MSNKDAFISVWDNIPTTIASGTSLTNTINLKGLRLFAIAMPSSWTAARLTFQVSPDCGTTWYDLYDANGTEITATAAASTCVVLSPVQFSSFQYVRLRSGASGSPVNQADDREISLILRVV